MHLPPSEGPAPAAGTADVATLAGVRVLIVDDNATNRRILTAQCGSWSMRTSAAGSAREALDLVRAGENFDVAVLDLAMPGMDGLELAERLRGLGGPPMVCLSSLGDTRARGAVDAWLTKPVKRAQLAEVLGRLVAGRPAGPITARAAGTPRRQAPLRLLLAEDNPVNRTLALRLLEKLGHRADVAGNGIEVLAALRAGTYDAVLMDVQMPELDGLETARRIGAEWPDDRPWLIAVTANAMEGDREMCLAAGMDDYLAKPIRLHGLAAALERCPRRGPARPVADPATAGGDDPPADWDPAVLSELSRSFGDGGDEVVAELVAAVCAEAPRLVARMRAALAASEADEVRRAAHTLRSNAATFGAAPLAERCRDLESRAAAGLEELVAAEPLVDRIEADTAALVRRLRAAVPGS